MEQPRSEDSNYSIEAYGQKELNFLMRTLKQHLHRVKVESMEICNDKEALERGLTRCEFKVVLLAKMKIQEGAPFVDLEEFKKTYPREECVYLHKGTDTKGDVQKCILHVLKSMGQARKTKIVVTHPMKSLCALQAVTSLNTFHIPYLVIQSPQLLTVKNKNGQTFVYMTIDLKYEALRLTPPSGERERVD